jgi:hypothetical protein
VPAGEALIATIRRTPVARMALVIARVPGAAIPASELLCGPSADSTASAPATADSSACGPGRARSTVTTRAVMGDVVYRSHVEVERAGGPLRYATVPAEDAPVVFGVHDEIAAHPRAQTNRGTLPASSRCGS